MIYLTHANEQNVVDAQAQICVNCGFPNGRGTDNWDDPKYNDTLSVFYIIKPPLNGWSDGVQSFTQTQMMAGITGVVEVDW